MKASKLIEKLKLLDPDDEVLVVNEMGCPAYDYDGQRFEFRFSKRKKAIALTFEREEDNT